MKHERWSALSVRAAGQIESPATDVWENVCAVLQLFVAEVTPDSDPAGKCPALETRVFQAHPVSGNALGSCERNAGATFHPAQNRMGELHGVSLPGIPLVKLGMRGMTKNALESVSPTNAGDRLRSARSNANFTQQEAAAEIGIARTTLVAIEKGLRRIRIDELRGLAKLYGVSVNSLLRREAVHVELAPRFRKLSDAVDNAVDEAIEIMSRLAKAEAELENLLGIKRTKNYPPERPILRGDVKVQAESDALELRRRLGLGDAPLIDIVTLLEMEMGARVYIRRMNSRISGLFAFDEELGACILLNASHSKECRAQSAAHECGHLVSTRNKPKILRKDKIIGSREERYADAFGMAFLMPPRAVMQKFQEVTAGSDRLTRRHVIVLAYFFGVSREAMVRRLEELKLANKGAWNWFEANGGITEQHLKQVLGDLAGANGQVADADRPTTLRLNILAAEAYRQELLTEGQLAELLDLGRIELREILDDLEIEGQEADAAPNLLN